MAGPLRPLVGVAAHVLSPCRTKIALIQRANAPGKGLWSVPGGKLDLGEAITEAACREAQEETGLWCVPAASPVPPYVSESVSWGDDGKISFHYVLVHVACALDPARYAENALPPIKAADDASDAAWVELAALEERDDLVTGLPDAVKHCGTGISGARSR